MPRNTKTPGEVLQAKITEFGLNPADVGKAINVKNLAKVLSNDEEIGVGLALRLAKLFGNTPEEWIKPQLAQSKKQLENELKDIDKAIKPDGRRRKKVIADDDPAAVKPRGKGGRPPAAKSADAEAKPKNKGGRPPKNASAADPAKPKNKGGRPRKNPDDAPATAGRRPGRPKKADMAPASTPPSSDLAGF